MKKLLLFTILICFLAISQRAKAQFDYIGGGIALATGSEYKLGGLSYYNKSFGLDLRASYDYNKKIKIVPDFKFYLPYKEDFQDGGESKTTVFVLNINAHYILNSKSRNSYRLYLLAGAHVGGWNLKDTRVTQTEGTLNVKEFKIIPGGNAGAGMEFNIGTKVKFFAEVKYVIAKSGQLVFTPGLLYNF